MAHTAHFAGNCITTIAVGTVCQTTRAVNKPNTKRLRNHFLQGQKWVFHRIRHTHWEGIILRNRALLAQIRFLMWKTRILNVISYFGLLIFCEESQPVFLSTCCLLPGTCMRPYYCWSALPPLALYMTGALAQKTTPRQRTEKRQYLVYAPSLFFYVHGECAQLLIVDTVRCTGNKSTTMGTHSAKTCSPPNITPLPTTLRMCTRSIRMIERVRTCKTINQPRHRRTVFIWY